MSYNKSLFSGVPKKQINKSRFNLSHEWKCNQFLMGALYPCMLLECLPGDEFEIQGQEMMFRFAALHFPIMHKITMRADTYYIPNRILWNADSETNHGWMKWINQETEEEHPTMDAQTVYDTTAPSRRILTAMGIPEMHFVTGQYYDSIQGLNAFPLSAYLKIWDEYYRIPQLEDEKWFNLQPGNNTLLFDAALNPAGTSGHWPMLGAKWEKDYFTSALPTPQIGEQVNIPMIAEDVPPDGKQVWRNAASGNPVVGSATTFAGIDAQGNPTESDGNTEVYLDMTETAASIKQLRIAEVLQSYYERIVKVGQRYRDFIEGLWGDDPQPGEIGVPIQIGSKFGRVQISDVMSQADFNNATIGTRKTGDYVGQANMYASDNETIRYKCREHGWIMTIVQINPNTSYGQGLHRMWRRAIQTDYPLDMFSGIGDQEILKEEVFYNNKVGDEDKNQETFGYIPRHSEMRYQNNIHVGALNFQFGKSQHLGRVWDITVTNGVNYDQAIEINQIFTSSEDVIVGGARVIDTFRVLPATNGLVQATEGYIYAHIFHSVYVNRQLPLYATPKLT